MLSDDLIQEQAYLVSRGVRPLALLESVSLEPAEMVNTFVRLNQVAVDPAIPFVLPRRDMNCAMTGFVSSIWLVTFKDGALEDIRYHDAVRVDDWERLDLYPEAPPALEEHMNAQVWLLRDVSWEPDFPSTAGIAANMYEIGQRQDVDGVIAINQWTLLPFIQALGSIPSPGGGDPITSRNLLSKLEQGSDIHGRAYMDLALQGLLDRIKQPVSASTLMGLASAFHRSLQQRDLLLFLNDPKPQAVIRDSGWDGRVRQDATDYLYVVDSNVGWSKADRNIERKVSYQVDLRKAPGPRINLDLEYNNHGGLGSPGCEPQWIGLGTDYSQLKNACYWNYLRVYVPQGAKLLSNTPLALPEYSVSVEIGQGQPGEDTIKVSSSYNRTVYSGLFALDAGEGNHVNLVYDLPPGLLYGEDGLIEYQLLIQKQPGIRRRDISVEIIMPQGYRLNSSSLPPAFTDDSRAVFTLRVEEDTLLNTQFARSDIGPN